MKSVQMVIVGLAILGGVGRAQAAGTMPPTPEQVRQIASEAYIDGFLLVDNYRLFYPYFINARDPSFTNTSSTPAKNIGRTVIAVELRSEPLVFTAPDEIEGLNYSVEIVDLTSTSIDGLERSPVKSGGSLLVAGPNWSGAAPSEIPGVLRAKSELALLIVEAKPAGAQLMQLWKEPPTRYGVEPLSTFLGETPPPPARPIDYFKPINRQTERTSLAFYSELAFLLQFCPPTADEELQRERFAKIGLHAGQPFGTAFLDAAVKSALTAGMAEGQRTVAAQVADVNSDRSKLQKYLQYDPSGSSLAITAEHKSRSSDNVFTIPIMLDSGGQPLSGHKRYTLTFTDTNLPPAELSWSLAMYRSPQQTRVDNPLRRYRIDSAMLPVLQRSSDGGLTIYIQHDPPDGAEIANWLPAPKGPFLMKLRLYGPRPRALRAEWQTPPVERVESP